MKQRQPSIRAGKRGTLIVFLNISCTHISCVSFVGVCKCINSTIVVSFYFFLNGWSLFGIEIISKWFYFSLDSITNSR